MIVIVIIILTSFAGTMTILSQIQTETMTPHPSETLSRTVGLF